jgi:hypothetical protein
LPGECMLLHSMHAVAVAAVAEVVLFLSGAWSVVTGWLCHPAWSLGGLRGGLC